MKYLYLILPMALLIACRPNTTQKTGNDLTALTITYASKDYSATIGTSTVSFTGLIVTSGETATIKSFTVSDGATLKAADADVTAGTSTLSTGDTNLVVTAEDGNTKTYVLSITAKQVPTEYATADASVIRISNVDYPATITGNFILFNNVELSGTEFVLSGGSIAISGVNPSFTIKSLVTTPTLKTNPSATEGAVISVSGTAITLLPELTIPITQSVVPINVSASGYLTTPYIVRLNITSPEVPDGF